MYLLSTFLAIIILVIYKLVFKVYFRRAFYKRQGFATTPSFIPVVGDINYLKNPAYRKKSFYTLVLDIYLRNKGAPGVLVHLTPFSQTILFLANPEESQVIFDSLGGSVDKSDTNLTYQGRMFPNALIHRQTDEGTVMRRKEYWPEFTGTNLIKYEIYYKKVLDQWLHKHKNASGQTIRFDLEISDIILDIIGKAAFGDEFTDVTMQYVENGQTRTVQVQHSFNLMLVTSSQAAASPLLQAIPLLLNTNLTQNNKEFLANTVTMRAALIPYIQRKRDEWELSGKKVTNLLDMLFQKHDAGLISFEDVVSDGIMWIFAGHLAATRTAMSFFYKTSWYPEILAKMREEIKTVIFDGKDADPADISKHITHEKVQNLAYIPNVLKESQRFDTSVPLVSYIAKEDFYLGNLRITKGTGLQPSTHLLHNNENEWINPREFIPERFDPTSKYFNTPSGQRRHALSFIPFAGGPRDCVGKHFSFNELKFIIVYLLSNFNIELDGDAKTDANLTFTLGTSNSLPVKLSRRNKIV